MRIFTQKIYSPISLITCGHNSISSQRETSGRTVPGAREISLHNESEFCRVQKIGSKKSRGNIACLEIVDCFLKSEKYDFEKLPHRFQAESFDENMHERQRFRRAWEISKNHLWKLIHTEGRHSNSINLPHRNQTLFGSEPY